jgi:hypothetical protein
MVGIQNRDYHELSQEDYNLIEEKHFSFIRLFIIGLKNNSQGNSDQKQTIKSL